MNASEYIAALRVGLKEAVARALRFLSRQVRLAGAAPLTRRRACSDRSMTGKPRKRPPKNTGIQSEITGAMKAFRTTEVKMPDIVGLFSTLTQKLTQFHIISKYT